MEYGNLGPTHEKSPWQTEGYHGTWELQVLLSGAGSTYRNWCEQVWCTNKVLKCKESTLVCYNWYTSTVLYFLLVLLNSVRYQHISCRNVPDCWLTCHIEAWGLNLWRLGWRTGYFQRKVAGEGERLLRICPPHLSVDGKGALLCFKNDLVVLLN